jgi:general stress protein YciG
MNVTQFARMGGKARAKALTKERRIEIARNAGLASSRKRTSKQDANIKPNEEIPENIVESISGLASK